MVTITIAVAWIAVAYRLWVSATHKATLWRTCFTVNLVCMAVAFTLYGTRADIDRIAEVPNIAHFLANAVLVAGLTLLMIYLHALRNTAVARPAMAAYVGLGLMVFLISTVAWVIAPLHQQELSDPIEQASSAAVVVYCLALWSYLVGALGLLAYTSLPEAKLLRHRDHARSVSLIFVGSAAVIAIPIPVLWAYAMVSEHVTGRQGDHLYAFANSLLPWPVLMNALGVLVLVAVPYVLDVAQSYRQLRRLRPLWNALTGRCPQVRLSMRITGGPRARLHLRLERTIIEIHDALRAVPVALDPAGTPSVEQVAAALRADARDGVRAADCLPATRDRDDDLRQLAGLARAFQGAT